MSRKHTARPWFLVPLEALPVPVPWSAVAISALLFGVGLLLRHDLTPRRVPWVIIAMGTLQWVIAVSASWILLSIALVFRWVGAHLPRIDLFQIEALVPFQRVGLHLSLLLFGLFAIRFVVGARPGNLGYLAITSAVAMLLGTALLLLPLWGAHLRIGFEKQRELAAVRRSIDDERARRDLPGPTNVSRTLLDLLEYKERVESVSDWPLDVPAVLRFGLYLTIPVLGWVGGAAMERLLDVFVAP